MNYFRLTLMLSSLLFMDTPFARRFARQQQMSDVNVGEWTDGARTVMQRAIDAMHDRMRTCVINDGEPVTKWYM